MLCRKLASVLPDVPDQDEWIGLVWVGIYVRYRFPLIEILKFVFTATHSPIQLSLYHLHILSVYILHSASDISTSNLVKKSQAHPVSQKGFRF